MNKNKIINLIKIALVAAVVIVGIFLRLYRISTAPNGLLTDEASFGYNAYSVLQTGKDEFANPHPLSIKSFGDYKYPAYVYAAMLPIKLFGLTIFAIRSVSLVSGVLLILLMFLLLKELGFSYSASLMGSLITAVSPWTLLMSRFAFESNLGLMIFSVGILLMTYGLNRQKLIFFIGSGFFFGLSWYCYLPFRPISLLLVVCFSAYVMIQRREYFHHIIIMFFVFIVTLSPLIPIMFAKEGTNRMKQNGMFTNQQLKLTIDKNRTFCTTGAPKPLCYLNSNKPFEYLRIVTTRYADMFSMHYLFLNGETQRYLSVENFGLFPFFLIPYYLFGLFFIFYKRQNSIKKYVPLFLISGLLISGLPSAVLPTPPIRTQLAAQFPFLLILIVYGFSAANSILKNKLHKVFLITVLFIFGFVYLFNYITIHIPKHEDNWEYIEKLMVYLGNRKTDTTIYMKPFIGEPLVFYAFYNKIPPQEYQQTVKLGHITEEGFQHVTGLRNIQLSEISWADIACENKNSTKRILYVTNEKLPASPLYVGKSSSGTSDLAYVYNVKNLISNDLICTDKK